MHPVEISQLFRKRLKAMRKVLFAVVPKSRIEDFEQSKVIHAHKGSGIHFHSPTFDVSKNIPSNFVRSLQITDHNKVEKKDVVYKAYSFPQIFFFNNQQSSVQPHNLLHLPSSLTDSRLTIS